MNISRRLSTLLGALALLAFSVALLPGQKVDLALVLLIDDSGSIDSREYQMQLQGYAAAFRNPQVIEAMTKGPNKSIAVCTIMFTNRAQVMIPWTRLNGRQSAEAFAGKMQRLSRIHGAATHIAKGIEFSINYISRSPYEFFASTIDLSADGWDNEFMPVMTGASIVTGVLGAITGIPIPVPSGPDPVASRRLGEVRNYAASRGITINCVAIEDPSLRNYFSRHVMTGPSAFTVFAPNFRAFTNVIQRKLVREITEGIKISTARQKKTTEVRRARAVPTPQPRSTPAVTQPTTPARASGEAEPGDLEATPLPPGEAGQETGEGIVEQNLEPAPLVVEIVPPVDRRLSLIVRDEVNEFPIDEVRLEALDGTEILYQEEPEGRPGLILVDLRTPAGQTPRLRVSAPLYLPRDVDLPLPTNEVGLQRQPLQIVW